MTLPDFACLLNSNNKDNCLGSYFDEHLALYNILNRVFDGKDIHITIDYKAAKKGCCRYIIIPAQNMDVHTMLVAYNDITLKLYGCQFEAKTKLRKNGIMYITLKKEYF